MGVELPEHLDSSEAQSLASLCKVHRDDKWKVLLFASEQEKAPVRSA